jgi:translation elongation factor EF-Tu-like GTPase
VYVLSKEERGVTRVLQQLPSAFTSHTDVTGAIELPKDKEMVMPEVTTCRSPSS